MRLVPKRARLLTAPRSNVQVRLWMVPVSRGPAKRSPASIVSVAELDSDVEVLWPELNSGLGGPDEVLGAKFLENSRDEAVPVGEGVDSGLAPVSYTHLRAHE